jgi:mannose/fructose/N-acetylgalactosamine-specific phosphotransferase system component IIC
MNAFQELSVLILGQLEEPEFSEHVPMSYARWVLQSLGVSGLLIPVLGIAILLGACIVVAKCRRPAVIAAYLLLCARAD